MFAMKPGKSSVYRVSQGELDLTLVFEENGSRFSPYNLIRSICRYQDGPGISVTFHYVERDATLFKVTVEGPVNAAVNWDSMVIPAVNVSLFLAVNMAGRLRLS